MTTWHRLDREEVGQQREERNDSGQFRTRVKRVGTGRLPAARNRRGGDRRRRGVDSAWVHPHILNRTTDVAARWANRLHRYLRAGAAEARSLPLRPVGVKLELTARCNLRCSFCYTDSPRRTIERAPELDDIDWLRIADEAVELGVVEAVVTGGEPLLRRRLTFDLLGALDRAGVRTMLNTNGWFLDDAVTDRLAGMAGLRVHVSLDGATPDVHDSARGLPGSWKRAVEGIDRLLSRGVAVQLVHVITPENEDGVPALLNLAFTLGVGAVRLTPVTRLGAASRDGNWSIDRRTLLRTVRTVRKRVGNDMRILVAPGDGEQSAETLRDGLAPMSVLVRPDGAVRLDSLNAVAFGSCAEQSLEACWDNIREEWSSPRAQRSDVTPYLDDDMQLGAEQEAPRAPTPQTIELMVKGRTIALDNAVSCDIEPGRAAEFITNLALERPYRTARVRWDGVSPENRIVRVVATGRTCRLNATAAAVMDACGPGRPADALDLLGRRHPEAGRSALASDVLLAARRLVDLGILEGAGS